MGSKRHADSASQWFKSGLAPSLIALTTDGCGSRQVRERAGAQVWYVLPRSESMMPR